MRDFRCLSSVLFKHGGHLSLSVIDRRAHLRDEQRDVLESRITVIKDVRIDSPHRAHIEILAALALEELGERQRPTNFRELYDAWIAALSIQALNQRFYTELFWWYVWAVRQVEFPQGTGLDREARNAISVIRLITRLIFVWFIKEKRLVPETLFDPRELASILKDDPRQAPEAGSYYLAILQNLFFATLNVEIGSDRKWAQDGSGMKGDRFVHSLYRHKRLFRDPAAALRLFSEIPFLNGGLFECLDRELTEGDLKRAPELKALATKEGNGWVLRVDGFSRRTEAQPIVPNKLFFGGDLAADLNADLGTAGKQYPVHGLIDIFSKYKFTVDENTPLEEEVALDPELLGKVFENLLASYNPDTRTTARKLSGSFYTPREVVDYMVDESLIGYFTAVLDGPPDVKAREAASGEARGAGDGQAHVGLRQLLSYADVPSELSEQTAQEIITGIERLRILDPACGSGAFLMGVLAKLVHVLRKLDPDNSLWRAQNRAPLAAQRGHAKTILDPVLRETRVEEVDAALSKFDRDFSNPHHADYTRKLYLIEKCIHGVDIQPIAVQIAKLRFFIALVVSQRVDKSLDNYGITALPNLETKIVAANTLVPVNRQGQMRLRDPAISDVENALAEANEHYFAARTAKTKRKWRDRIVTLRDDLARLLEEDHFLSKGAARQLVHWNPFDQNASAGFFDPEWMFQLREGFDIAIGNPPYVRQEEIKDFKEDLKANYECFTGTADLYVYFCERSVKLLKTGGVLSFITSNKWYRAKYGEKLREWMTRNTRLRRVIDFGDEPVFKALAYPTIVIATRREQPVKVPRVGEELLALNWLPQLPVEDFSQVFAESAFPVPQATLTREAWQLEPPLKRRLLDRIRLAGAPLEKWCDGKLYYGIKTGFNKAFVVTGVERARLIAEDPSSEQILRPFVRGRDVKRWRVEPQDLWLIFIPWHFPLHEDSTISGVSQKAERAFKKEFPAIYRHLTRYKSELAARDRAETGIRYEWYALQRFREYWREFEKPKIIFPAIEDGVNYAADLKGYFGNDKTNIIVTEEWRFLLAVLNSQVSWWFTKQTFSAKQGGFFEFKPMYVSHLPVPAATTDQKALLSALVDAVVAGSGDVVRFEQLINGLVYELFFPDVLHAAGIKLFDACKKAGLLQVDVSRSKRATQSIAAVASVAFEIDQPIYGMLFDLQALDPVRIIEERE